MAPIGRVVAGIAGLVFLLGAFADEFYGFRSSKRIPTWAGRVMSFVVGAGFIVVAILWG
jgi:hypothetical protein